MKAKHHLNKLLDELDISVNAFEEAIGVGQGTISKSIIEPDKRLSDRNIKKITRKFPDVSENWLLTGEGSMFLTTGQKIHALAQETGKPHDDDKDVRGLTDYLLAEKLKSMQDMIDEMRQWKKEIEDKLDEKEKKK